MVQLSVELDRIEIDEPLCARADAREMIQDGLAIDSLAGDVPERVGLDAEHIEARGIDRAEWIAP